MNIILLTLRRRKKNRDRRSSTEWFLFEDTYIIQIWCGEFAITYSSSFSRELCFMYSGRIPAHGTVGRSWMGTTSVWCVFRLASSFYNSTGALSSRPRLYVYSASFFPLFFCLFLSFPLVRVMPRKSPERPTAHIPNVWCILVPEYQLLLKLRWLLEPCNTHNITLYSPSSVHILTIMRNTKTEISMVLYIERVTNLESTFTSYNARRVSLIQYYDPVFFTWLFWLLQF